MFTRLGYLAAAGATGLLMLLLSQPPAIVEAQVTNPLTRASIGGIPDCKNSRVFCVGKQTGAEYSVISGATCATESGTSASGSAIKAAKDSGLCAVTTPCTVSVGPGIYDECVSIDNIQGLSLVGSGWGSTIIRPTVTAATSVNGGVIRVANSTATVNATRGIEIAWLTSWNDAWSPPESSIMIGRENGPTASGIGANWNDVFVHNARVIGNHDGLQWFGSELSTDDDPPRFVGRDLVVINGADAVATKGFSNLALQNIEVQIQTNYCESTLTAFLEAQSGAVAVNSGDPSMLQIQPTDDPNITDFFVGRQVITSDNGGAGSCGATGNADGEGWIIDYDEAAQVIQFLSTTIAEEPTTGCNYSIAAVTHNDGSAYLSGDTVDSPCQDIDWTIIRAGAGGSTAGYWKSSWVHLGTGNTTPTNAPDAAITRVQAVRGVTYVNDFGPLPTQACNQQAHVTGFLAYTSSWQSASVSGLTGELNINVDLQDSITCADPISGIALTGDARFDDAITASNISIIINNRADADENVRCAIANTTVNDGADPADSLRLESLYCDINNSVAGYAGTTSTLLQGSNGVLVVGDVTSDAAITTSGTVTHLAAMTSGLTNSAALDFNFSGGADQGTCQAAQTITVTGAVDGDLVRLSVPNTAHVAGIQWEAWVSGANTVSIQPCCNQAADCADTPSATFTVRVETP